MSQYLDAINEARRISNRESSESKVAVVIKHTKGADTTYSAVDIDAFSGGDIAKIVFGSNHMAKAVKRVPLLQQRYRWICNSCEKKFVLRVNFINCPYCNRSAGVSEIGVDENDVEKNGEKKVRV